MKAGSTATRSDRINPGVPAEYPVATFRYAPGFHGKNATLHVDCTDGKKLTSFMV